MEVNIFCFTVVLSLVYNGAWLVSVFRKLVIIFGINLQEKKWLKVVDFCVNSEKLWIHVIAVFFVLRMRIVGRYSYLADDTWPVITAGV